VYYQQQKMFTRNGNNDDEINLRFCVVSTSTLCYILFPILLCFYSVLTSSFAAVSDYGKHSFTILMVLVHLQMLMKYITHYDLAVARCSCIPCIWEGHFYEVI